LLEGIAETGSIRAAAARMSVAYSLAWRRLHEMETILGVRLVERHKGGAHGGKALLTPAGHAYVAQFNTWAQKIDVEVSRRFQEEFGDR
jgi:molybdate transport system regulatory protein